MRPAGRQQDLSLAPTDDHACVICSHTTLGPATGGSNDVLINGRSALRVGDRGINLNAMCCGPNTWEAARGAPRVLINGKRAHRQGDAVQHCGGSGHLVTGSGNVLIGDHTASGAQPHNVSAHWFELKLAHANGESVAGARVRLHSPDGQRLEEVNNGETGHPIDNIRTKGKMDVSVSLKYRRRRS